MVWDKQKLCPFHHIICMVKYGSFSASLHSLYIIGFSNSEQFQLICLAYVYQFVQSVISHRKYKDKSFYFTPSSIIYKTGSQQLFMRTNFIRITKLRFALQLFNIPETVVSSKELISLEYTFKGGEKSRRRLTIETLEKGVKYVQS